ncbi:MAG: coniferyl aldehyde dehydrogenase [Robiginitomaculum sp.]|nr:coniferyl aldehyde dehydrogenase [Robiginitomaculum sp.]
MPKQKLETIFQMQRDAFSARPNPSWVERKSNLEKLSKAILDNEEKFQKAISDDFGNRAYVETTVAEIAVIIASIKHALKHTPKWMKPQKVPTAMQYKPAVNKIMPQPLGVVGIISPWNYPLQLCVVPLVAALGAGNRAMIKPSELTPRFADLIKTVLGDIFSEDEVYVAVGDLDVAQAFSNLPYDHLLFTGSTNVGRIIAGAAAKNLTPVTLELGGKSPVIIDDTASDKFTHARIVNGKLFNAGQTCVAPDYLLMPERRIDAFSEALIKKAEEFYPTFAGNPDYTSVVADSHYSRLQNLLEDAENKGARIRTAGNDDKQVLAQERRIPLTVVTNTTPDMKIMQEEIFGPLLPIVASETLEDSMKYIEQRDRPLALYWFGEDKAKRDHVLKNTISGGVSINETAWHVVQEDLPFGGVGPSGMGAYHGIHGFRTFSHMKGVFFQSKFSGGKMLYPPYTEKTQKILGMMRKFM